MQSEKKIPEKLTKMKNLSKEPKETNDIPKKLRKEAVKIDLVLSIINVVSKILAVRLFIFLSIIGSFVLALIADNNQTLQSIAVVVLFACVTTLPLTLLEWRNRNGN